MILILSLVIPLLWNVLTVSYGLFAARQGKLTPLRFALVFALGFSLTIALTLFIVIAYYQGINRPQIGFVFLVFAINLFVAFPASYLFSRSLIVKHFPDWFAAVEGKQE